MVAIALYCAVSCYLGAALLAAMPLARPIGHPPSPVGRVVTALGAGILVHGLALVALARAAGTLSISGLGPALSFAALAIAVVLAVAEILSRDVTLTLVGG